MRNPVIPCEMLSLVRCQKRVRGVQHMANNKL